MLNIDELLSIATEAGASDLHIKVGSPPTIRIDGELQPMDEPTCTPDDTKDCAASLMSEKQIRRFSETNEIDFAYSSAQVGRYRVNVYRQRGTISIACRQVVTKVPDFDELNLPPVVQKLALEPRGMVLVTGTTGSGKTTTLAAMIDHINRNLRRHIVTIEDPIEILHRDQQCIINQREVGLDTENYISALKYVLRQDPDIILIGEMRDQETVRTALALPRPATLFSSTLPPQRRKDSEPYHRLLPCTKNIADHAGRRCVSSLSGCWFVPTGGPAACSRVVSDDQRIEMILDPTRPVTSALPFKGAAISADLIKPAATVREGLGQSGRRLPGSQQPARFPSAGPSPRPRDACDGLKVPAFCSSILVPGLALLRSAGCSAFPGGRPWPLFLLKADQPVDRPAEHGQKEGGHKDPDHARGRQRCSCPDGYLQEEGVEEYGCHCFPDGVRRLVFDAIERAYKAVDQPEEDR